MKAKLETIKKKVQVDYIEIKKLYILVNIQIKIKASDKWRKVEPPM